LNRARWLDKAASKEIIFTLVVQFHRAFFEVTFLTLGAAALVAVIVFALGMPETAEP
jgi:hypothetical protein